MFNIANRLINFFHTMTTKRIKTNDEKECLLQELPQNKENAFKLFMPEEFAPMSRDINKQELLLGAIFGDIIGCPHEFSSYLVPEIKDGKDILFKGDCRFTDDTVLMIATLDAIINGISYEDAYRKWAKMYPHESYGGGFYHWFSNDNTKPYNSFGNGSAMRVPPIGIYYDDVKDVISNAYDSAICTHNHPEGIKGAIVTAVAIWIARFGTKDDVCKYMKKQYGWIDIDRNYIYDFHDTFDKMNTFVGRKNWVTCQNAVPFSIRCAIDSNSYEEFMKRLIYAGQDVDTDGAIAGTIATAFYGCPYVTEECVTEYLNPKMIELIKRL